MSNNKKLKEALLHYTCLVCPGGCASSWREEGEAAAAAAVLDETTAVAAAVGGW